MTSAKQLQLEPIILFFNEALHGLERQAVSIQILLIAIGFLVGFFASKKINMPKKFFHFKTSKGIKPAFLTLVCLVITLLVLEAFAKPNGLIWQAISLVLLFIALTAALAVVKKLASKKRKALIEKYRNRIVLPVFGGFCIFKVVQIFGDPGSLFGAPVIRVFNAPFNLGDAILLSAGIVLWINLSSLTIQALETYFETGNVHVSRAIFILARYCFIGFGIVIIIGTIGIDPTIFGFVTGGLSVGIGFGLKEIISNFVSGIWLLIEGSTKPGDIINLKLLDSSTDQFQVAKITNCGLRAVTVTNHADHSERIIPNNLFFTNQITTYTKNHYIIARSSNFSVDYGSNPLEVINLITAAVASHPEVLKEPPPSTRFIAYGESSLEFSSKYFIHDVMEGIRVTSQINLLIWETLRKHSIEIPFPHRTIHISQPPELLKADESNG